MNRTAQRLTRTAPWVPQPNAANCTIVAGSSSIANNGVASCSVTITVLDSTGAAIAGVTPVLTVSGTGNTVIQPGATNIVGVAVGSFVSTTAETKTITATANGIAIIQTASCVVGTPSDVTSIVSLSPASGTTAGGTPVAITVTGATGTPTVTFGGVSATSIVVVSSTSITCVTPAGSAGAVDLVVGSHTDTGAYTYSVVSQYPNQPAGLTTLTTYAFNEVIPVKNGGVLASGWGSNNASGDFAQASDSGSSSYTPPNIGALKFPAGFVGGNAPAKLYYVFAARHQIVYYAYWWKPDSPWQGANNGDNKLNFIADNVDNSYMAMKGTSAPYHLAATTQIGHTGTGSQNLSSNIDNTAVVLGSWHLLEQLWTYSTTSSSGDGKVSWWLDGVLKGQWDHDTLVAAGLNPISWSSTGFAQVDVQPIWSGNGTIVTDQYMRYDDLRVAGS